MRAIEAVNKIEEYKQMDKPLADLIGEFHSIVHKGGSLPEETKQLLMKTFRDSYNMELSDFFAKLHRLVSDQRYHLIKSLENTELNENVGGPICGE